VKNKPTSSLVVPLGQTLIGMPFNCLLIGVQLVRKFVS